MTIVSAPCVSALDTVDITLYGLSRGCNKCEATYKQLTSFGFEVNRIDIDTISDEEKASLPRMEGLSAPLVLISIPSVEKDYHWNDMRFDTIRKFRDYKEDLYSLIEELDALSEINARDICQGPYVVS